MADDTARKELACDCGGCVLDLRGFAPGDTVRCSYCGREHIVPGKSATPSAEKLPPKSSAGKPPKDREKELLAELKASAPAEDELDGLIHQLDKSAPRARPARDSSTSRELAEQYQQNSRRRRWTALAIYLTLIAIVALLWYVRNLGGTRAGEVTVAIAWHRYPAWVWALIVAFGVVLGIVLHLLYVWFFVYSPRRRRAAQRVRSKEAAGAQE